MTAVSTSGKLECLAALAVKGSCMALEVEPSRFARPTPWAGAGCASFHGLAAHFPMIF